MVWLAIREGVDGVSGVVGEAGGDRLVSAPAPEGMHEQGVTQAADHIEEVAFPKPAHHGFDRPPVELAGRGNGADGGDVPVSPVHARADNTRELERFRHSCALLCPSENETTPLGPLPSI